MWTNSSAILHGVGSAGAVIWRAVRHWIFFLASRALYTRIDPKKTKSYNDLFFEPKWPLWSALMYAVIKTGGKQYKVENGVYLKIEKINAEDGATVEFDKVLMVSSDAGIKVGKPYLEGGKVTATVRSHGRHDKIKIVKFRRRKHYMKQAGHRQHYTEVMITGISAN